LVIFLPQRVTTKESRISKTSAGMMRLSDHRITRLPDHPILHRVLYVAYPLLPVSEHSAGGAEQMLWTLEREIAARGIDTTVAAAAQSSVSGELFVTGEPCSVPDSFDRRNREHQDKIVQFIRSRAFQGKAFDLVHDESGSFWRRAAEIDIPVLATLHLPRDFYPAGSFDNVPDNVTFNCVSESQVRSVADLNPAIIPNGILLHRFQPSFGGRSGLLWLGRICEEKAPHLALDIAARARQNIILAGQVYPFSYHQQYFKSEVAPRLQRMPNATFIASPSAAQKYELLRRAKALLITSQAAETSSLVGMEAAASGTPAIAFRQGALPEIIKDGITGFLVDTVDDAVAALQKIQSIMPEVCADYARTNFSSNTMAEGYQRLYSQLTSKSDALLESASAD
jgi:glycosyltransferase involved in cell wall biosynthesis